MPTSELSQLPRRTPGEVTIKDAFEANRSVRDTAFLVRAVRPLGTCIAWIGLKAHLAPLHISYTTLCLGMTICGIVAIGGTKARIAAALLLLLWQTLDTADGTMARSLRIRSNYGGFIDYAGGMVLLAFFQVSLGLGLYLRPEHSLANLIPFTYEPAYALILGAYSSVAAILARLLLRIAEIRFSVALGPNVKGREQNPSLISRAMRVMQELENLGGFQIPLMLVAALFERTEWFLAFYCIINVTILVAFVLRLFVSLRNHHAYRTTP